MSFLEELAAWVSDPANWVGGDGLLNRTVAALLALPAAVVLAHYRRGGFLAVSLVNIGRAIPSFGIVALALPVSLALGLGLGFWPTFLALVVLAMPPMFTNAYTGVRQVDQAVVEAGRGTGMTDRQVLIGIEVPLAMPVIWTAMRVASVQVIATATLAAWVGGGGLGRYVFEGFAQGDDVKVFVGGVAVALLAVLVDFAFSVGERWALPRGTRHIERTELKTVTAA
jgi:osmoprotectant transport system permease protein